MLFSMRAVDAGMGAYTLAKGKIMSTNQSQPKLGVVTSRDVEEVLRFTTEVVTGYPDRNVGSISCQQASVRIAEELTKHCDPGTVKIESFTCHPKAFLHYLQYMPVLMITATVLSYFNQPLLSTLAAAAFIAIFYPQTFFYWQWYDRLFPPATGYNVYGTLEPEQEVRQQIILCGHHDAAYTFRYLEKTPNLYAYINFIEVGVFTVAFFLTGYTLIIGRVPEWVPIVMIILTLGSLPYFWFLGTTISPGAGDNMIATAMITLASRLVTRRDGKSALQHTRLIILSTDGEEAGLRGSRAFVAAHQKELKDVDTYALALDTFYKADHLIFFTADLNQTVKLSRIMTDELHKVATDLGYTARVSKIPVGGGSTDAATFAAAGIETAAMLTLPDGITHLPDWFVYHTSRDTVDTIEPKVVECCLNIMAAYIQKKDSEVSK
jgi:aminopeptidase YwaD